MSSPIEKPEFEDSRIKDVWIALDGHDFTHTHLGEKAEGNDDLFIGRVALKERLKMLLAHSATAAGAYLVTGFRGMGKTSFVRRAIAELADEPGTGPFETIHISLSQDRILDEDIFRQLSRQLFQRWDALPNNSGYWKPWRRQRSLGLGCLGLGLAATAAVICCVGGEEVLKWAAAGLGRHWLEAITGGLALACVAAAYSVASKKPRKLSWRSIRKKLSNLNDRLDARVSKGEDFSLAPEAKVMEQKLKLFDRSSRREMSFEIATPKEVERELLDTLEEIDRLRRRLKEGSRVDFFSRLRKVPRFIFVIDELDKIDLSTRGLEAMAEPGGAPDGNSLTGRRRQAAVAHLLANLKSFLNEAPAKFIFIGGREMYDAALADIADRDSFYSSIFHDIIYVNSFFKDKIVERAGVTRMAEAYVSKIVVPQRYAEAYVQDGAARLSGQSLKLATDEAHGMEMVFSYLRDTFANWQGPALCKFSKKGDIEHHIGGKHGHLKLFKLVFLLQNLIVYLTFRSNGSPKKMAGLLEKYMTPLPEGRRPDEGKHLAFNGYPYFFKEEKHSRRIYLRFNNGAQYEICMTSNLYRPYVIVHSRYLKMLSDKLLFSTAFIMDYLLKFHPFGFSWSNVELIPDAVLNSKDPNLRQFIQDLVRFLGRNHFRETLNGMFQYKYYSKVSSEIRYLSKISEASAAAFNFTLDESLQLKKYYLGQLDILERRHEKLGSFREGKGFVHSVAFVHNNLGDLYYYDQEFDKAIEHYDDALQPFREKGGLEVMNNHQLVLFVRTQLKLGMSLEKIMSYDSAHAIYRSLIADLPTALRKANEPFKETPSDPGETPITRLQLLARPYVALLDLIEKQRHDGITFSNLRQNLDALNRLLDLDRDNPLTDTRKGKTTPTDSVRLNTLYADYYHSVGNILFFKNANYKGIYSNVLRRLFLGSKPGSEVNASLGGFIDELGGGAADYCPPLSAYAYYRLALREHLCVFEDNLLGENDLLKAVKLLKEQRELRPNNQQQFSIANLLGKIGDCFLASVPCKAAPLSPEALELFEKEEIEPSLFDGLSGQLADEAGYFKNPLQTAVLCYRLSSVYFLRSGRTFAHVFQYKKLFFVLSDHLACHGEALRAGKTDAFFREEAGSRGEWAEGFMKKTLEKMLAAIAWIGDASTRPQLTKYREITGLGGDDFKQALYNNISSSPETREAMLLVNEVQLRLHKLGAWQKPLSLKHVLTPYDLTASKYLRMLELKFKAEYNFRWLQVQELDWLFEEKTPISDGQKKDLETKGVPAMVEDSIFCLYEVIRMLNVFGVNYVNNHSCLATMHYKLAHWCTAHDNLKREHLHRSDSAHPAQSIEEYSREPRHHMEVAVSNFNAAVQTHNGGRPYKDNMSKMSFLEDDFSDNLTHFSAASERYRINTGSILSRIKKLKKEIEKTSLYKVENHWG